VEHVCWPRKVLAVGRTPGQMEVRRVITISTPRLRNQNDLLIPAPPNEAFYTCKKLHLVGLSLIGSAARTRSKKVLPKRPSTSFRHAAVFLMCSCFAALSCKLTDLAMELGVNYFRH
jgi:hypothetical protein